MGTQGISKIETSPQKTSDRASKAMILVALLFLSPFLAGIPATPEEHVSMMTSGKQQSTDPDVAVTDLHVTTPSVLVAGVPTLSPENHIIRVGVLNIGGSQAVGNVTLKVDGVLVDNRTVTLNPGAGANHLLYWDASSLISSGLQITASWEKDSSSADSNSSNDVMSLNNVNVVAVEDATDISDSLPADG